MKLRESSYGYGMTQNEFNRLLAKKNQSDSFRSKSSISPKAKNELFADLKAFQAEFKDLQATAEALPDEYVDELCSTNSYPFDVALDEVDEIDDWCEEAEEFLKADINNWGVIRKGLSESTSLAATKRYAKARHDRTGIVRRSSGKPYFVHPDGVAQIVTVYGGTNAQIQAAYLHDTMEDTGENYEHLKELFGDEVADIVNEITNDPYEVNRIGKERYISNELCNLSHDALLVKLADMYYNQKDYPSSSQAARQLNSIQYLLNNRSDLQENELDLIEDILGELL